MTARKPDRYGTAHRALRRQLEPIVRSGRAVCWRCQKPIGPREQWHLGHADDGTYAGAGPEHVRCNLSDGGRKRAAQLYGGQQIRPSAKPREISVWSRHWCGSEFDERCPACRRAGAACAAARSAA